MGVEMGVGVGVELGVSAGLKDRGRVRARATHLLVEG